MEREDEIMKTKKPIGTVLKELLNNNNFLKILSVFLALFVWIYIIYNVNPINERSLIGWRSTLPLRAPFPTGTI